MAQTASFNQDDFKLIARMAEKAFRLIGAAVGPQFGTIGIKSSMAGGFACGFIAGAGCDDDNPEAVADGVGTFNGALRLAKAPFRLELNTETADEAFLERGGVTLEPARREAIVAAIRHTAPALLERMIVANEIGMAALIGTVDRRPT